MKTPLSKTASGLINTKHGEFGIDSFWNGIEEAIVLKKGDLQSKPDVLCRIQSECIDHFFMGTHCDCMDEVDNSLENIAKEQLGLLIYLKQEGKGQGLVAKIKGNDEDKRKYDIAAQIIQFYQIQSIILITNNKDKEKALRQNNIPTYSKSPFGSIIILGTKLKTVIRDIVDEKANPILVDRRKTRILIIGDLNIDNFLNIDNKSFGGSDVTPYEDKVGGTGYNAAIAFKNGGFSSILFGKIGSDNNGDKITKQLKIDNIISFIGFSEKPTGFCNLLYFEDKPRTIKYNGDNANEYDINDLKQALILADINKQDYVFITSYLFTAKKLSNGTIDKEYCKTVSYTHLTLPTIYSV